MDVNEPPEGEDEERRGAGYRRAIGADSDDSTGAVQFRGELTTEGAASRPPPLPSPKVGEIVGHYELIRPLGKGGMGEVFLARDTKLGRRVAIKFVTGADAELGRRFIAEARATAQCGHENIVIIHEADEAAGRPYMVLEYLQGQPLSALLEPGKPLAPARAVELMIPVVKALACAHAQGIVHRDLKPDNIFVTESGTVKVLDFGIASLMREGAAELAGDVVLGTLSYMSPEQWGSEPIDHRTDLWATGVLLYKLLSGQHPLQGRHGAELAITGDLTQPTPSLAAVAPGLPAGLAEVVDRCLRKRQAERHADANELLRELEPFQAGRVSRQLKGGESPYAGLASFQEADSARFFGRSQEIAALTNRLRSQALVAVVGSSGAGKSSFVRAGLVPALKGSGEPWQVIVLRPSRRPLEVLVDALLNLGHTGEDLEANLVQREQLLARLRREPGHAGAAFRAHARLTGQRLLVFIDQFEELYTLVADAAERLTFTTCLASIADDASSPLRVVLSLRSDFLDRVSEDRQFMAELGPGLFFLAAPAREGLEEALVQPAEMAGYRFESREILEDMLGHLQATPGALPLLQFAASKLWDSRDPGRHLLTLAGYQALGGIAGALSAHADAVLRALPARLQQLARTVLPRLVTPERTRELVSFEELRALSSDGAGIDELVNQLVRARLLVVQTSAGSTTVELVHESLVTGWPLLRRWLDEGREDLAFREQLRIAARQWEARGRAPGLLWRGEAIDEARAWRARHTGELPTRERAFLEAALALATRAQRTRQALVSGTIAGLLLVVALGAVALIQVRRAETSAVEQAVRAQKEAQRAHAAEAQVTEQLARVRQEQEAKAVAEAEVERGRGDLRVVNRRLEQALDTARTESASAKASASTSSRLAGSLQTANGELSTLLAQERERAERLEQERRKIVTELR